LGIKDAVGWDFFFFPLVTELSGLGVVKFFPMFHRFSIDETCYKPSSTGENQQEAGAIGTPFCSHKKWLPRYRGDHAKFFDPSYKEYY
jgi:hypothetical protein